MQVVHPHPSELESGIRRRAGALWVLRLLLGSTWAGALLLMGMALWTRPVLVVAMEGEVGRELVRAMAVSAMAGAQFMFMVLVADGLCPRAPTAMTGTCKLTAGLLTLAGMAWAGWATWQLLGR